MSKISNCTIEDCILERVRMNGVEIDESQLSRVRYPHQLSNVVMRKCVLKDASLVRREIQNSLMRECRIENGNMSFCRIENVDFSESVFQQVEMSRTMLENCVLKLAKFVNCVLAVELSSCDLDDCDFSKSGLSKCRFVKCKMDQTNLRECVLSHACFVEVGMRKLILSEKQAFSKCLLEKCIIHTMNLVGFDFSAANLSGSDLSSAKWMK